MNAVSESVRGVIAQLTATGAPFELVDVQVGGQVFKAYRNAPATLADLIQAGRAHADKEFIAYQGDRWSYARFFAAVDALAGRLQTELGIQRGDRVAIAMRNRPEWAVTFAAVALVGAVPAPLNSFGLGEELRDALTDVSPVLLVCDLERLQRVAPHLAALGCRVALVEDADQGTARAEGSHVSSNAYRFSELIATGGPQPEPVICDPDDPALLLLTSGSASRAKAVLSSHRAVCQALMNIDFIGAMSAMTSPKTLAALMARGLAPATLTAVPLFHVSGLHAQLLTTLRNGRRLVFMHRWDPAQALQMIRDEKITQFNAAPAMVQQLLQTEGFDPAADARTLGGVGFGGAGLPQRLIDDVLRLFPESMSGIGFGLTETNGVGAAISGVLFAGQPRSSGIPSPIMALRIVDVNGNPLPAGQAGEIWMRGVTVMQGYWGQPQATAQAVTDGWFHSGDIGYLDDAGFLYVVDRIKDVINRNSEKIAAAEVESCLSKHPAIEEVAVIAVPDEVTGEAVAAVVVPKAGARLSPSDIQAHVGAHLAAYKVPSTVVVRREPLPRNPTGKLIKARLRQEYANPDAGQSNDQRA